MGGENIYGRIESISNELKRDVISWRRNFHRHAEVGFTEFRTASLVVAELQKLGFEVLLGDRANRRESMLGVPPAAYLEACRKRAVEDGGDPAIIQKMEGGLTGVVGILKCGDGPVFAMRFDMDANEMGESEDSKHRPAREGFSSKNYEACHGCGHDGHTAMGLGLARVLSQIKSSLRGTVKLIFQPAEEGVRGARPMVDAGVVDDADYFVFSHLGLKLRETGVIATTSNILSTTKFHVDLAGVASHPLASPEQGRNALIAASTMALAMHSLPPLGEGSGFRIVNVGVLKAGLAQGIIASNAHLEIATFADGENHNSELVERVLAIIEGGKTMFGVSPSVRKVGESPSADCDPEMVRLVSEAARKVGSITRVNAPIPLGASEDGTYFMRRVQSRGGKACCVVVGASLSGDHHNPSFDFDEKALDVGTRVLACLTAELLSGKE